MQMRMLQKPYQMQQIGRQTNTRELGICSSGSPPVYQLSSPDRMPPIKNGNMASPPHTSANSQSTANSQGGNYLSPQYYQTLPSQSQALTSQFQKQLTQPLNDSYKYQASKPKSIISPAEPSNSQERKSFTTQKEKENIVTSFSRTQALTDIRNIALNVQQEIQSAKGTAPQTYNIQQLIGAPVKNNYQSFTTPQQSTSELAKIASNLRDLMHRFQKHPQDCRLSDSLNDKILDLLQSIRKVEEQQTTEGSEAYRLQCSEYKKRIQVMSDDYGKLKSIMDSLQDKMTVLVQENSKLNKNLLEYDTRLVAEQGARRLAEERNLALEQEQQRLVRCLEGQSRELEDMRKQTEASVKRQLFDDSQFRLQDIEKLRGQLQEKSSLVEQLQGQLKQKHDELADAVKIVPGGYTSSRVHSHGNSTIKFEQLELKMISLQIENENLRSEMAHHQVDGRAMDSKNEMIMRLEERIKALINDKSELEHQKDQVVAQYRDSQNEVQHLKGVNEGVLTQLRDVQLKAAALQKSLSGVEDQLSTKEAALAELNMAFKLKCETLAKHERDSAHRIATLEEAVRKEHGELEKLRQTYAEDKGSLMAEYKRQMERMDQHLNEKLEALDRLGRRFEQKSREHDTISARLSETAEQLSRLKDQHELQKKTFASSQDELQRRIKQEKTKCDETVADIRGQLVNVDQHREKLQREVATFEARYVELEAELEEKVASLQQQTDQYQQQRGELERTRSANFNLQEELLRAGMLITQLQSTTGSLKSDLASARTEHENLIELLRKRKDEVTQLHQSLEAIKNNRPKDLDDSRKSILRQQEYLSSCEQSKRENAELKVALANLRNEYQRKCKDVEEREQEVEQLRRKYDETVQIIMDTERKWGV